MSYATNIHVSLRNGSIDLTVTAAKLREAGGMPSGKNILLQLPSGILKRREVIVRPYYRRFIRGELHVFASEVITKEPPSGK